MKATELQKEICDLIISQAMFWRDSNDIQSFTHLSDIDESIRLFNLDSKIDEDDTEELIDKLTSLYYFVKQL